MNLNFDIVAPGEIEARSFQIITQELGDRQPDPAVADIVKRVIHTAADFDYAENLVFSPGVVDAALEALQSGATIVTDTQMARSGINKAACKQLGCTVECFIADEDVAQAAKVSGTTRACAAVDKAAALQGPVIFAVGNAPTALIRLHELMESGAVHPALVIGVPVGFVNVVQSKELILTDNVPSIVARGRKGGSNVAAAICNALLYRATGRTL